MPSDGHTARCPLVWRAALPALCRVAEGGRAHSACDGGGEANALLLLPLPYASGPRKTGRGASENEGTGKHGDKECGGRGECVVSWRS